MDKKILSRASYIIISVGVSIILIYSALPYYCLTTIAIPGGIYWDYAETQQRMMLLFPGSSFLLAITTLRKKRTVMDVFLNVSFALCILLTLRVSQSHIIYAICVYIFAVTAASCKVIDLIYSEKYAQLSLMTRIRRIYYICRERVIVILLFSLAPMTIYMNIQESSSSGRILYQAVDMEQEAEVNEFPELVSEEQWSVLALESKLDLLERFVNYECEKLGVSPVNVYMIQEAVDGALAYYSHADNGIFFSLFFLRGASLEDALYVSAHETYHRYENEIVDILNLLDSAGVSYQRLAYFNEAVALRQAAINYRQDVQSYDTYAKNMLEIESEKYATNRIQELKDMGYLQ